MPLVEAAGASGIVIDPIWIRATLANSHFTAHHSLDIEFLPLVGKGRVGRSNANSCEGFDYLAAHDVVIVADVMEYLSKGIRGCYGDQVLERLFDLFIRF